MRLRVHLARALDPASLKSTTKEANAPVGCYDCCGLRWPLLLLPIACRNKKRAVQNGLVSRDAQDVGSGRKSSATGVRTPRGATPLHVLCLGRLQHAIPAGALLASQSTGKNIARAPRYGSRPGASDSNMPSALCYRGVQRASGRLHLGLEYDLVRFVSVRWRVHSCVSRHRWRSCIHIQWTRRSSAAKRFPTP